MVVGFADRTEAGQHLANELAAGGLDPPLVYRPETERPIHCSTAVLPDQYDAFVWFDKTNAVTALATLAAEGEDETYPFGL